VRNFFVGLLAGSLVSFVAWVAGWQAVERSAAGAAMLIVIPSVKLLAGATLLFFRQWATLGAGILCSIAIGFLIFFVQCAANFRIQP
jgi:hypothetical protein